MKLHMADWWSGIPGDQRVAYLHKVLQCIELGGLEAANKSMRLTAYFVRALTPLRSKIRRRNDMAGRTPARDSPPQFLTLRSVFVPFPQPAR
jgi:hypothetical protein